MKRNRTRPHEKAQGTQRRSFDRMNRIDRIDKKSIFCLSRRKAEGSVRVKILFA